MNTHKHARLTFARRIEMVKDLTEGGLSTTEAALKHGVTAPTVRKWLGRFLTGGEAALSDASSRPVRSPKAIEPGKALLIVELRAKCRRLGVHGQPCSQPGWAVEAQRP